MTTAISFHNRLLLTRVLYMEPPLLGPVRLADYSLSPYPSYSWAPAASNQPVLWILQHLSNNALQLIEHQSPAMCAETSGLCSSQRKVSKELAL